MVPAMRLVLALSALVIIYIDPLEPDRLVEITYGALILYTLYSVVLYGLALRRRGLVTMRAWSHWADVAWYTALIALSSGTNSIFFFGFLFSTLVASFQWGYASGLRVAIVSAVLFTVVGSSTVPPELALDLNRFLLRPIYLLVLGYMMAHWGGSEINHKRRLGLLNQISTLANPRLGAGRTIAAIMERIRGYYDAEICLLMLLEANRQTYSLRRVSRGSSAARAEPLSGELAKKLLPLPPRCACVYRGKPSRWWSGGPRIYAYDLGKETRVTDVGDDCETVSTLLDARAFVTVPIVYQSSVVGRMYIITRPSALDASDIDFMVQVLRQVTPIVDHIRLVDSLASQAADDERRKIARDIHDSVIQPYIGLKMGLAAVQEKLANGADVPSQMERLVEMTELGISSIRRYVMGLREAGEHEEDSLPAATRRFISKFAEATGIDVQLEALSDMRVNDRLAAQAFQMIVEGLSNVRRHTHATRARVVLSRSENEIMLQVENDNPTGQEWAGFIPRSISERAVALGGATRVELRENGSTAVVVEIPL